MNQQYQKTGSYACNPRNPAGKTIARILRSRILDRPFDPVAYAAALEVLG